MDGIAVGPIKTRTHKTAACALAQNARHHPWYSPTSTTDISVSAHVRRRRPLCDNRISRNPFFFRTPVPRPRSLRRPRYVPRRAQLRYLTVWHSSRLRPCVQNIPLKLLRDNRSSCRVPMLPNVVGMAPAKSKHGKKHSFRQRHAIPVEQSFVDTYRKCWSFRNLPRFLCRLPGRCR